MFRIRTLLVGAFIALLAAAPLSSFAASFSLADKDTEAVNVVTATINEDTYAFGPVVRVLTDHIKGDLFAGAADVIIGDTIVDGDVMAAGSVVSSEATIAGDFRVAGSRVTVSGSVEQDLMAAGSAVDITGTVVGDAYVGGAFVNMAGTVKGNFRAAGEEVLIDGTVNGDVEVRSTKVTFGDHAVVNGDVTLFLGVDPIISDTAVINGEVTKIEPIPVEKIRSEPFALVLLFGVVSMIISGLVLVFMAPLKARDVARYMVEKPGSSMGWGLVYAIVPPVIGVVLLFTVVAFSLGLVILAIYAISLYAAALYFAFFLGTRIILLINQKYDMSGNGYLGWSILFGSVAYGVLMMVPVVNGMVFILGGLFSLGSLSMVCRPMIFKSLGSAASKITNGSRRKKK